jgi:hypothetical protein
MAAPRTKLSKFLSIHATLDDVEKKKHKKNPFDGKYVNFCLADLTEVGQRLLAAGCWFALLLISCKPYSLTRTHMLDVCMYTYPDDSTLQVIDGKPLADAPAAAAPEDFVSNSQGSQQSDDSTDDAGSSIVESAAAQIHARVEVRHDAGVHELMLRNSVGTACSLQECMISHSVACMAIDAQTSAATVDTAIMLIASGQHDCTALRAAVCPSDASCPPCLQLIKSMKLALVKQTTQAVKQNGKAEQEQQAAVKRSNRATASDAAGITADDDDNVAGGHAADDEQAAAAGPDAADQQAAQQALDADISAVMQLYNKLASKDCEIPADQVFSVSACSLAAFLPSPST